MRKLLLSLSADLGRGSLSSWSSRSNARHTIGHRRSNKMQAASSECSEGQSSREISIKLKWKVTKLPNCYVFPRLSNIIGLIYTRDGSSACTVTNLHIGQATILRLIIRPGINTGTQTDHLYRQLISIIRLHRRTIQMADGGRWSVCLPVFINRRIIRQTIVACPISMQVRPRRMIHL